MRRVFVGPVMATIAVAVTGPSSFFGVGIGVGVGAADTPVVTGVMSQRAAAHLVVASGGLPSGFVPRVSIQGPHGFAQSVRTTRLVLPTSGTYRVWVHQERQVAATYRPTQSAATFTVGSGSTVTWTPTFRRVAPVTVTDRYPIATFRGVELWVDPARGSDANSGTTRATALASVAAAWRRVPMNRSLTTGVRINLVRGRYSATHLPNYWEHRWGTARAPIILRAVDGVGTAILAGDINAFDVRHLYLIGIDIVRPGDAVHCERCSFLVLRRVHLAGEGGAHETVKVNQSDHIYIEDSDIHGADDNAIDFVAVHAGHLVGNRIHGAQDWCAYVKGGSAGIAVVDNEIFNCGTGGFTAGQGTGFEFMEAPYLRYEASDIRVMGNLVHDTDGAGLGVNGGYNVLMAHNTMYRVGRRSHALEIVQGGRSCDAFSAGASVAPCQARRAQGGWGTTDSGGQWIPNRRVVVVNNVVANPPGYQSTWSHFDVHPPATPPVASGVPAPARADDLLTIRGNVLLNGDGTLDLGLSAHTCDEMSECSSNYIAAHNALGASARVFRGAARGDFRLLSINAGGSRAVMGAAPSVVPTMPWNDVPSGPVISVARVGSSRTA